MLETPPEIRAAPAARAGDVLPPPGDATYRVLSDVIAFARRSPERAAGGVAKVKVTHPESPSVLTAFQYAVAALPHPPSFTVEVGRIQTPDPRRAKAQVDFELWAYSGTSPRPTLGMPDAKLVERLAEIARLPLDLGDWERHAAALAGRLRVAWTPHLASAMVYASPPPESFDPFDWVQRMQLAAALVLAHVRGQAGEPWPGGAPMRALFAVALGPVDWTVSAAVRALGRIAAADPVARADIERLFLFLRFQVGQTGFTCYEAPLAATWIGLGGHPPAVARDLGAWAERAEKGAPDDEETHDGLYLGAYAELCVRREKLVTGGAGQEELGDLHALYGVPLGAGAEWDGSIARRPELARTFRLEKAKARLRVRLWGLDPTSADGLAVMGTDPRALAEQDERAPER